MTPAADAQHRVNNGFDASAPDVDVPYVAGDAAQEAGDASHEAGGDAGMCVTNADCAEGQWCVKFVKTRGPIAFPHYECVKATCATVDCSCAQSMCGSYQYCRTSNGQLECNDGGV